jgi:hypothetical protein
MTDLKLTDKDYQLMIYYNFNKYQVNLKDQKEKSNFKNFLISTLQKDKNQAESFPSARVSNKEITSKKEREREQQQEQIENY